MPAPGHRYERKAIEEWVSQKGTSPMTRAKITSADLVSQTPGKLKAQLDVLKLFSGFEPSTVLVRVPGFASLRASNTSFDSEVLQFADAEGRHQYRFKLRVYPNGNGEKDKGHVSVFLCCESYTEQDPTLEWPMKMNITVTGFNHENNSAPVCFPYGPAVTEKKFTYKNAAEATGYGRPKLLNKDEYGAFLKNDCMTFAVRMW
jgi:hypothetical protein